MGAFSNMDYELQNSEAAVSDAFTEDDAMDESSFPTGKEDSASCTVNLPPCQPFLHG